MRERTKLDHVIDAYVEGSKKFYPGLEFSSRSSWYGGDEPKNCEFEFGLNAKNLAGTRYDCSDIDEVIHYTSSIQTVIDILNSGVFRLSNLSSLNDPQEMSFTNRYLEMRFSEDQIKEYKKYYYSASFCSVVTSDYPDEFSMWRLYGNDGYGAAIVFEIANNNADWFNFLLGKVQYGESDEVSNYKDYLEWFESFQRAHSNPITNQPKALTALMALHKNIIWEHEKEIRLLTHSVYDKYTFWEKSPLFSKLRHSLSRSGKLYSFMELPLFGSERYKDMDERLAKHGEAGYLFKSIPILKISKIIIGYRENGDTLHNADRLMRYFSRFYGYDFYIHRSHLCDFM